MASRFEWTGLSPFLLISLVAIALTAWQAQIDRSVFERFFAAMNPVWVVAGTAAVGALALAYLRAVSELAVFGPGAWTDAVPFIAWVVPLFAVAAIGADLLFRYSEDMNVAMPAALRFYPAIAVVVEIALHAVPIAVLVAIFGAPTGFDATLWRIALPVAALEAVLQAVYAPSIPLSVFSAIHLLAFGVVQVWTFWRFGFVSMLGFRLAYYLVWHLAWGTARLSLLF